MNYMDFDLYLIRDRNQQLLREVNSLRLERRLRENNRGLRSRGRHQSWLVRLASAVGSF